MVVVNMDMENLAVNAVDDQISYTDMLTAMFSRKNKELITQYIT